ncbi:hypothetical protein GCM10028796_04810 [Ramlibacter monticola]|uniref:Uncharacterized protein n=1 Tax=Ramlibacter monticola TaxID=1926872 RepID=A0A936YXP0_9BURK|nr:hypothetical protein [Ramlibacter monticola]MBL0391238.1 hypothetical protein [Ramlibacter monticola]
MNQNFPFTSYDFWAYLTSGGLLLAAIDLVAGTGFLGQKDWTWAQTAVAVASAYIAGQLTAALSSPIFERGLVGTVLGYPRDNLFGQCIAPSWLRKCLPAYYQPLPPAAQKAALTKGAALGVDGPGERLFWPAFSVAKESKVAKERMDNFINQYGFARNIALVSFVDAAILAWSYNWHGGKAMHGNLALVALGVGVGMTLRYIKFFRHYGLEVFTTFAYSKEKDKEKEAK